MSKPADPSRAVSRLPSLMAGVILAMVVAAALFLARWSDFQRLGPAGVRLQQQAIHFQPVGDISLPASETLAGTNVVALPEVVPGYRSEPVPLSQIVYEALPKDSTFGQRRYFSDDKQSFIDNYVVLMGVDRTSIHQPQYCLVGQGFNIRSQVTIAIPMNEPHPYELRVQKLIASKQHRTENGQTMELSGVLLYWFVSGEKLAAEHHERMTSIARSLLTKGVLERWAYITYFSPCYPGEEEATASQMVRLIQAAVPGYQLVPAAGSLVP